MKKLRAVAVSCVVPLWAATCLLTGCSSEGERSPGGAAGSGGSGSGPLVRAKSKFGVIVQSQSDPWISKELEIMKSSHFFPGGFAVREAATTSTAESAMKELRGVGCNYVVLIGHEGVYDGPSLVAAAKSEPIRLIALHWGLFDKTGNEIAVPLVVVNELEVGDMLAQNVLKTADTEGAKCLMVGPQKAHRDFFLRVTATLMPKFDVRKAVHCDVPTNRPVDWYKSPVLSSIEGVGAKNKWVVIGADDACAQGAMAALTAAGATKVYAYGVGATPSALALWDKDDPRALTATMLLNPYPEVQSLAKTISRWEATNTVSKKTQIGGVPITKADYKSTILNTIMATAGDKA